MLGGKCERKKKGGFGPPKFCTLKLEEKIERKMCKDFYFFFIFLLFVVDNLRITAKNEHLNYGYFENIRMCHLVELRGKTMGYL